MSMTDPIADMLTRIRNAGSAQFDSVSMPYSNVKRDLARVLQEEGFIESYEQSTNADNKPALKVTLKYVQDEQKSIPVIASIKRESKPGLRRYVGKDSLPRVFGGYGVAIISTSQGLMTAKNARSKGIGGEYVCSVY